jgi:hydroxymethylpyrimidine pyrophosphatase-like HAD family hydrolase
VANAHPDLLAVADTVLPSNDDDGVGHLIELVLAGRADR